MLPKNVSKTRKYFTYGGMGLGAALCFYKVSIEKSMPFEMMPIMAVICVSAAFGAIVGFFIERIQENEKNNG